jgi:hypothetical protein
MGFIYVIKAFIVKFDVPEFVDKRLNKKEGKHERKILRDKHLRKDDAEHF